MLYISYNYCDVPWLSIFFFWIGAMAYRGDPIGCTVMFNELKEGKVPIQFSLNGRQITQDKISIEYNPAEKWLYPFIGMGNTGIRVLAKVSSWSRSDRSKSLMTIRPWVLPNVHECFCSLFLLENIARKEKKIDFHKVNSLHSQHHYVNYSCGTLLVLFFFRVLKVGIAFFCMANNWHVLFVHVYSCVHLRTLMPNSSGRLKPQRIAWQKWWLQIGSRSTQLWSK